MEPEEKKTDAAEMKPAPRKRAPRKTADTGKSKKETGDAGTAAPVEKKKPTARRTKKAEATAPAPEQKPEEKPAVPKQEAKAPAETRPAETEAAKPAEQGGHKVHTRVAKGTEQNKPAEERKSAAEPQEQQVSRFMDEQPRTPDHVPGFAVPEVVGGNEGGNGGNGRRKRRRNRNRRGGEGNQPQQQNQGTPRVDPDELCRRAWKIFLGEVTEEGLALMDDRTAAEASRRAFRVAELFLQEASRHRPAAVLPMTEPEETEEPAEDETEA